MKVRLDSDVKFSLERYKLFEKSPIPYHEMMNWTRDRCPFSSEILTEANSNPFTLSVTHPTAGVKQSKNIRVLKDALTYYNSLSLEFDFFTTVNDYFDIFLKLGTRIVIFNNDQVRLTGFLYRVEDHSGVSIESTLVETDNWYGVYPSKTDAIMNAMFQITKWNKNES